MTSPRKWLLIVAVAAMIASPTADIRAEDKKDNDGYVALFNGKDLTGWKIPEPPSGEFASVESKMVDGKVVAFIGKTKAGKDVTLWRVEDGVIIGGGPASHIFSERGDYENFHYKFTAKISDQGNSGQYFRTKFMKNYPNGYEAQINSTHSDPVRTGSLYNFAKINEQLHKPDEWFTQEVVAKGNHIQIFVNGKQTVDYTDPKKAFTKGHFALQGHDPGTVVTFKKIEYKPIK